LSRAPERPRLRPPDGQSAPHGVVEAREYFRSVLRGSAGERARFIADYPYDLSPSTDDSPFFFNYYRYRGLVAGLGSDARSGVLNSYHADFPVGHAVLLASLVQITLLGVAAVLYAGGFAAMVAWISQPAQALDPILAEAAGGR
jgi:hypothetical protein